VTSAPARVFACALACLAASLLSSPRAARAADPGAQVLEDFKRGLREDAVEARAAAVDRLAAGASALSEEQRRSAAKLLRKAFETDADVRLRVSEVRALAALRDEASWVPVLLAAIKDRQPEVAKAARLTLLRGREDLLDVVRKLLREDQDPTFRADLLLLADQQVTTLHPGEDPVVLTDARAQVELVGDHFEYAGKACLARFLGRGLGRERCQNGRQEPESRVMPHHDISSRYRMPRPAKGRSAIPGCRQAAPVPAAAAATLVSRRPARIAGPFGDERAMIRAGSLRADPRILSVA